MNEGGVLAVQAMALGAILALGSGCATTRSDPEVDPLEPMNRGFYNINEKLDKYFMKPVAKGYWGQARRAMSLILPPAPS